MRVPEISMVVDDKQTTNRLHERGHHIVPDFSVGDKNGKNGHQQPLGKTCNFKKIRSTDFFLVFCIGLSMDPTTRNQRKKWSTPSLNIAVRKVSCVQDKDASYVVYIRPCLDAFSHLYKRVCPSICPSVGRSVRRSPLIFKIGK